MHPDLQIISINNLKDAENELKSIGVDRRSIDIMAGKAVLMPVKLYSMSSPLANILKQEMLSIGGEAAVSKKTYFLTNKKTDVLLLGTVRHYKRLISKLRSQPLGLKKLGENLDTALKQYQKTPSPVKCRSKTFSFKRRTYVMGILNVTPDSFSDGSRFLDVEKALDHALKLVEEGADIIDIGGESTRPGSNRMPASLEKKRIIPVIKALSKKIKVPISVDTYKSEVARAALDNGAEIINDISGLRFDRKMPKLAAKYNTPVIIMHIKGKPKSMQIKPKYNDLLPEIIEYLMKSIEIAEANGIKKEKIIIDPGIGFGKTTGHNMEVIKKLRMLKVLGHPILLGASRKSFIGKTLNHLPVEDRLEGTISATLLGLINGANFFRVHDVGPVKKAIKMAEAILS